MYLMETLLLRVLFIMYVFHLTISMCPSKCVCHNDILEASCYKAGLEYLPIQLNPELHNMNLSVNKITTVHFLNVYIKLEYLDLSQNRIRTIEPFTFEYQRHLVFLNISHNNITRFNKESFEGLHSLIKLDISYNHLQVMETAVFRHFTSLQLLKATNNQLISLERGSLTPSKHLVELFLDENELSEIPGQAIGEAPALKVISLKRNIIDFIRNGDIPLLPKLRVLMLKANNIQDVDEGAFSKISALEYLDISDNNLTFIPTASLEKLQHLINLNIGGNSISSIPSVALKGLFHLKRLRFDRSIALSRIDPRAFVDNIDLEVVLMDNNIALETLPTRLFHGNPRLNQIFIRNNRLSTLEVTHFPLDQLKHLLVGGNPLDCNCSLLWLWRLEQEQENKVIGNSTNQTELILDMDFIKCGAPPHLLNQLLADLSDYQLGCSWGWSVTMCSVVFATLIIIAIAVIIYLCPGKLIKKKEEPPKESVSVPCSPSFKVNKRSVESITSKPELSSNYREVELWDTLEKNNALKSYQHFSKNVKKPHIMYV